MRVLDMNQPIGLNDIYTDVNILEKITRNRRLNIDDLLQNCSSDDFDRFGLGLITEKRVPGLEAVKQYPKLMVLGKPGAGKTTFLKYLAIQCISGEFHSHQVPIFITLKEFSDAIKSLELQEFIIKQLKSLTINETQLSKLLNSGKFLVLLDGLDEVGEENNSRVIHQIKEFSQIYHHNQFVITCRIAARDYIFEKFTEIEVADFDKTQIAHFVGKWFKTKNDLLKAERLIKKLETDQHIWELASNPLLLTLLCLVFEESGSFPQNRSKLYKEGLDVLLKKWDAKRNIERYAVYKNLSLKRKEDMFSHIAQETFERGDYFFKQKEIEQLIIKYIENLPDASTDPERLKLDGEAVLKSIESQHGLLVERARNIYSFSHLTFHEYFTAKRIVDSNYSKDQLVKHINQPRWREVFLLVVGMLDSADDLLRLMKQEIDGILANDEKLQKFLTWVEQKSDSIQTAYNPPAVRAFYFSLFYFTPNSVQTIELERDLHHDRYLALKLAEDLDLETDQDIVLDQILSLGLLLNRALILSTSLDFALNNPELSQVLQQIKDEIPTPEGDYKLYGKWWMENGERWTEQFIKVMIEYRNIGYNWQLNNDQEKLLRQYINANRLLVDCLNSDCYVSRQVRQDIEDTLLLPVKSNNDKPSRVF